MTRLNKILPEEMTPEQHDQYERLLKFRTLRDDQTFGGPFDPWLRSPEVARRAISWGNFIWSRTSIDRRLVELGIIITARFWESNVEWVSHTKMALDNGVSQAVIDSVFERQRPQKAPNDELLIYDICVALHETHQVPVELYNQAIDMIGEQGLMDLIATIGYYTFVAMTLTAFDVGLPDETKGPFPI